MTEGVWDAANDIEAIRQCEYLTTQRRKQRLLSCAMCRLLKSRFTNPRFEATVRLVEQHVDGVVPEQVIDRRKRQIENLLCAMEGPGQSTPVSKKYRSMSILRTLCSSDSFYLFHYGNVPDEVISEGRSFGKKIEASIRQGYRLLLHDIFGNPFRPVAFDPAWRTATAVGLAERMYESRDFSAMPILADALEDAGCDHPDVLVHCRGDGPHVRGCWVVDLVLGKA